MKHLFVFLLTIFLFSNPISAQNDSGYFEMNSMNGFPNLVKQLGKYDSVLDVLRFVSLSDTQYNSLFYKNYVTDSNMNKTSYYHRMNLIFTHPFNAELYRFQGYKFTINPLIKQNQYSQHLFRITKALDSFEATLATNEINIKFPEGLLSPIFENSSSDLLVKTQTGIEFNIYNGETVIKDIVGFEMDSYKFNQLPLTIENPSNGKLIFSTKKDNQIIFENNEIAKMVDFYGTNNQKKSDYYLCGLQFTDLEGHININGNNYTVKISELDFTENLTAGVLKIDASDKTILANDIAIFSYKKSNPHIKSDFKVVKGAKDNLYFTFKQDYKSVYMYFILYR